MTTHFANRSILQLDLDTFYVAVERLLKAIDKIRDRFGKSAVRKGGK